MKKISQLVLLAMLSGMVAFGCSKTVGDDGFQKTEPDDKVRLFEVLNESPALKSAFESLDPREFNRRMNDMMYSNPELMGEMMVRTGEALYVPDTPGGKAIFPETVDKLSKSFNSFHTVYRTNPDSLDTTVDIVKAILDIDPRVMSDGASVIIDVLIALRNWEDVNSDKKYYVDANDNGIFDDNETYDPAETATYPWKLFGKSQELESIGYDGVNTLIENISFARTLYGDGEGLQELSTLIRKSIETVIEEHWDVEEKMFSLIDYLEKNDPFTGITAIEKEVADWLAPGADPVKYGIGDFIISDLFPKLKNPVYNILDEQGNIVKSVNMLEQGRQVLDRQASIFSESAKRRSLKYNRENGMPIPELVSNDESLYTKWFLNAVYHDMDWYDRLEDVEVFDFDNNELLRWLRDGVMNRLNKTLSFGADQGISRSRLTEILWSGWDYKPTGYEGNSSYWTHFPGLFAANGYLTLMKHGVSSDSVEKPFRLQMHDMLNGDNDGEYDDGNPRTSDSFTKINLSYANGDQYGDGSPEGQMEAIMTNLKYYVLSNFYCTKGRNPSYPAYYNQPVKKWALTPEDGRAYFGDPNRNVQTLFGNLVTNVRNLVVLNEDGNDPRLLGDPSDDKRLSMLTQFMYVMSAGCGIVDPLAAPAELTIENCMRSMGSPLADRDYLEALDMGIFGKMYIRVLGNNEIFRASYYEYKNSPPPAKGNYTQYTTQNVMMANELLQPGTFRRRSGGRSGDTGDGTFEGYINEWHGKFAPSQGDLIGVSKDGIIPSTRGNLSVDKLTTSHWVMSEIALAAWEGYGPYTYRGKAPNGSDCKYKSDYYTDWYYIKGRSDFPWGDRGPGSARAHFNGVSNTQGRYRIYEGVYRPGVGEPGFDAATDENGNAYLDSTGSEVPKYCYQRFNSNPYAAGYDPNNDYSNKQAVYNNAVSNPSFKDVADCSTREEAIRKNFKWLMNKKKYIYIIPLHTEKDILGHVGVRIELYALSLINCNGIAGISKAKRYGSDIAHNAKWGLTGINSNFQRSYEDETNYFLDVIGEGNSTWRYKGVSFNDTDYMVCLDYMYFIDGWFEGIAKWLMEITELSWNALGDGPVLPAIQGDNYTSIITLGNKVYGTGDIIDGSFGASDIRKFNKFYKTYYNLSYYGESSTSSGLYIYYIDENKNGSKDSNESEVRMKAKDLPYVPRVAGVTYPVAFGPGGAVSSWDPWNKESEGKFDLFIGLFGSIVGTLHEDGIAGKNIADADLAPSAIPTVRRVGHYSDIDRGDIAFYARDGFRAQIDHMTMMQAALNESKRKSGSTEPEYKSDAVLNLLVDHNPGTDRLDASDRGMRQGLLPFILESKYANLNYPDPIKKGVEQTIQNVIRTYLNNQGNFLLTAGSDTGALESYYLKDNDGNYVLDENGKKIINPNVDWRIPINKLRYFCDSDSLDQLRDSLDFMRDLIQSDEFKNVAFKTIVNGDNYLVVKHIDEEYRKDVEACNGDLLCEQNCVKLTRAQALALKDGTKFTVMQIFRPTDVNGNAMVPNPADPQSIIAYDTAKDTQIHDFIDDAERALTEIDYHKIIQFVKDSGVNDIEKLYNFTFDSWGDELNATKLQENLDEINKVLVKFAGVNFKEGFIDGIYRIKDDALSVPEGFKKGEKVFGLGKYVEITKAEYDANSGSSLFFTDGEGTALRYYKYLDIKSHIFPGGVFNSNSYTVEFEGLKEYFDFRTDSDTSYSELCEDYYDRWYRGRIDQCPNVYSLHKYDLNMAKLFSSGESGTTFVAADFTSQSAMVENFAIAGVHERSHSYNRPRKLIVDGKSRDIFIDWVYRWGNGINIEEELNYQKDYAMHDIYDNTDVEVPNFLRDYFLPADYRDTGKYLSSPRKLVQKSREMFIDKIYDDKYDYDLNTGNGSIVHYSWPEPAGSTHRHKLNNFADIIAILFNPGDSTHPETAYRSNPHYVTGRGYTAWNDFINTPSIQDITPDDLRQVRTAVGSLLYNSSEDCQTCDENGCHPCTHDERYSNLVTNLTANLPKLLRKFQLTPENDGDAYMQYGETMYDELTQLGLIAFSPNGVGTYLLDNLKPASQYTAWNMTEEIDSLLKKEIFTTSNEGTFWFELGHLLQSFGVIVKQREINNGQLLDYYSSFKGMFE